MNVAMQITRKIVPHLWYDTQAREAADWYCSIFPDARITHITPLHDTPSGDAEVVNFILAGQPFMAISAGPHFSFNPSISFMVNCSTADEVDRLWDALSADARQVLFPLDAYPWSPRYGWLADKYGLNWQIIRVSAIKQKIMPCCLFVGDVFGRAEEALHFYQTVFTHHQIGELYRFSDMQDNSAPGMAIAYVDIQLEDLWMVLMDGPGEHHYAFNEAISFVVHADTQQEIDSYWQKLSAIPEAEQCGWCKDKFGISWQVVPTVLDEMMRKGNAEQIRRLTRAFLQMKKMDIEALQKAYSFS